MQSIDDRVIELSRITYRMSGLRSGSGGAAVVCEGAQGASHSQGEGRTHDATRPIGLRPPRLSHLTGHGAFIGGGVHVRSRISRGVRCGVAARYQYHIHVPFPCCCSLLSP